MMGLRTVETVSGKAVSIRGNDIDTDRIIPAAFLKIITFDDLGRHLFAFDRKTAREQGGVHPLDQPDRTDAEILFVNRNFGCGSSREHAPQAIMRWNRGIKAIVGESFAEIFRDNCAALGIPCLTASAEEIESLMAVSDADPHREFRIDLKEPGIHDGDSRMALYILPSNRNKFLSGHWDTLGSLLDAKPHIAEVLSHLPYVDHWR